MEAVMLIFTGLWLALLVGISWNIFMAVCNWGDDYRMIDYLAKSLILIVLFILTTLVIGQIGTV